MIDSTRSDRQAAETSQRMATTLDKKPTKSGSLDKVFLIGSALLVCIFACGAFWIAEVYQINPMWVFFLWNSLGMVLVLKKDFRGQFRKPAFVAFLAVWAVIHGCLVVVLMRRTPVFVWFLAISFELYVGYLLAELMFGIQPRSNMSA